MFGIDPAKQHQLHRAYVEAMIATAWRDGVITEEEHELIRRIAVAVGLDPSVVPDVTVCPSVTALVGARVCFTGAAIVNGGSMERCQLESLAARRGLRPVAAVSKKGCDLLRAADATSMSGKAKKARDYGIPVLSVSEFLARLN